MRKFKVRLLFLVFYLSKMYHRQILPHLEKWLFQNKVLVLYGARQVGKTTISKYLTEKHAGLYLNCERNEVKNVFLSRNPEKILSYVGEKKFIVLDEAQKIASIGEILKLLIDTYPERQFLATGSSSFNLANQTTEPLTGRKITFVLYPLSLTELNQNKFVLQNQLENFLLYGMYPDIVKTKSVDVKKVKLDELAGDYLYKDVLEFENLKRSDLLHKLLQALALQLGNEVSYHELAVLLQTSTETIQRYIQLLEQSFVIYRLSSLSRNLRKELAKKVKIFFYDLGVRNSILQNFTPIDLRNDIGALWENFCINERKKLMQRQMQKANTYFWRTYNQKEIDYIEEKDNFMKAFECKWNSKKIVKVPKDFADNYPQSSFNVINQENYFKFLT